jgi:nicotinamide-nucleotide amidase
LASKGQWSLRPAFSQAWEKGWTTWGWGRFCVAQVERGADLIAEIVTIGTELLLGEIVDSNAAHIARQLAAIGVDHYYTTTVGDNEERIVVALGHALQRSDVVITTGGLGPTVDDVTRQAVARLAGRELVFCPELLAQIDAYFCRRGYTMTENNRRQAFIPEGATGVPNPVGTAPAFILELDDKAIFCLPGVPHEMEHLMRERVLPYLQSKMGGAAVILSRWVHTVAIGESAVDQAISDLMHSSNPTLGTRAHPGQTDVCITAKAATREEALQALDAMEARVRDRLGSVIYGVDEETLPGVVVAALRRRGLTLALAETTTDGLIARQLQGAEGGDEVVAGARVAEDRIALARQFSIPEVAGDEEMASALATALRDAHDAGLGLAILEGGGENSLQYMALATPTGVTVRFRPARGRSNYASGWTLNSALDMVRRWVLATDGAVG